MSDLERYTGAIEALIFSSDRPCTPGAIRKLLPDLTPARIAEAVDQINERLGERPYEIRRVDGGYQFRTRPEYGELIRAAQPERKARLSRAALETLAVIAYRQPVTRAQVEDVRSVDCGPVMRTLLERGLLRIVGRRDAPGRPALYGTTSAFLQTFGLASLRDMPALREIESEAADSVGEGESRGDTGGSMDEGTDEAANGGLEAAESGDAGSPPREADEQASGEASEQAGNPSASVGG